jgi:hypothetical protein
MKKVALENERTLPLPSLLPQGGAGISGANLMTEHRRLGLGPTPVFVCSPLLGQGPTYDCNFPLPNGRGSVSVGTPRYVNTLASLTQ